MKPLRFHLKASKEAEDAYAYYENKSSDLASRFTATIDQALLAIQRLPTLHPPYRSSGLRKLIIRQFPYTIYFLEMETRIWIVALAHQSRRPDYWIDRIL